ncbi:MAG: protein kinase [Chthoniobacterales bacterium]
MNKQSELIADLVEAALDLDPAERRNFLERGCGDNRALRAEIESLLKFQTPARDFIEKPAYHIAAESFTGEGELRAGQEMGGYKILSLLGEGGMGDVYLAEDAQLGRTVAIKLVKRVFHGLPAGGQFEQEERILAALNHPHIAHLYGVAVTGDGRPYIVMEYVEGEPLDRFCEARAISLVARLELFRKICSAVSYAHQHLVIHRDLKPANIRVTAEGEPKLLDFGIAKLLDDAADSDRSRALAGMMTPEYASPEQARGESLTTASDIYSLGVIFYQMLTGEKPYRLTNRKSGEDIARTITETEPRLPSHQPSAISNRKSLSGDLDSIALRAMEKNPAQRYLTVAQFSEDIRRHLEGFPVVARKGTWTYRTGKFLRRHTVGTVAVAIVAGTLLGGIFATTQQARRADRQRARAERRFQDVRKLANSLIFDVHDAIENLPGSTSARALIVQEALQYLDSLAQESHDDPSLQRELAAAYIRVGNVQGNPSNSNLGDTAGALRSYQRAQEIAEQLLAISSGDAAARRSLALVKEKMGDLQALAGDIPAAVATTRASLTLFREIAQAASEDRNAQRSLAISHIKMGDLLGNPNMRNAGDFASAMANFHTSLAILQTLAQADPADLKTGRFLGLVYERTGSVEEAQKDVAAAEESYRKSQQIREKLARDWPDNAMLARDAAIAQEKIANVQIMRGDLGAALANREKSLEAFRVLYQADPKNVMSKLSLAISHIHLGDLLSEPGLARSEDAAQNYRAAIAILQPLLETDPQHTRAQDALHESEEKLQQLQAAR